MDKSYRWVLTGVLALSLMGCSSWNSMCTYFKPKEKPVATKPGSSVRLLSTRQIAVNPFSMIEADGWFDIDLLHDKSRHSVTVQGYTEVIKHMTAVVKDGVLHIHMDKFFGKAEEQQIHVFVRSPNLQRIRYSGEGTIRAESLKSGQLDVVMDKGGDLRLGGKVTARNLSLGGHSKLKLSGINSQSLQIRMAGDARAELEGHANLCEIHTKNNAWVQLRWVDSPKLIIRMQHQSTVILGGKTEFLVADLFDRAHFDGKYLRAREAYVKTHQESVAEVTVLESRNTLAKDNSNIYYYTDPDFNADFMAREGSVLDMQEMYLLQGGKEVVYNHDLFCRPGISRTNLGTKYPGKFACKS